MNWFDIVPAFLSAIASIAAAIAAFIALRISKQAIRISESSALASHHQSASLKYTEVLNELHEVSDEFSEISYSLWVHWARDIEVKDNYNRGGSNARPLRHVLSNSSEMLAKYGLENGHWGRSINRSILSIVRNGIGKLSDAEYQKLLKKADCEYQDFEGIFGIPSKSSNIETAPAFRWACYQLIRRVNPEDWGKVWEEAWLKNGWLDKYQAEYLRIKPIFVKARESLKLEVSKLSHTAFPLSYNPELSKKYDEVLMILDNLIDGCDSDTLEDYKSWKFNEEISQLVVCSMAIGFCAYKQIDLIYVKAHE